MTTAREMAEKLRIEKADRERAKTLCREIMDSEAATFTEKLEAIKILHTITSENRT